jgi:hypothetical protein
MILARNDRMPAKTGHDHESHPLTAPETHASGDAFHDREEFYQKT